MTTFYDLIKELAHNIGDTRESVATGGSATTLIDTTLSEANGLFNGGTLLIDQATPVTPRVTTFVSASGTFSFSAIGTAVTAGTGYTAIQPRYPLDVLKRMINLALLESERYMEIDTSLTLVADQELYALPIGVTDVRRVEIGTVNESWDKHYAWRVEDGYLRFLNWIPSDTSQTVRLHHAVQHAPLSALADVLDDRISRHRLMICAIYHALNWRVSKVGNDEPNTTNQMNLYISKYEAVKRERVSQLLERDVILAGY